MSYTSLKFKLFKVVTPFWRYSYAFLFISGVSDTLIQGNSFFSTYSCHYLISNSVPTAKTSNFNLSLFSE